MGYDFAEKKWLTITLGTSNGFSVSLVPTEKSKALAPKDTPHHNFLGRLILAVLRRASTAADSLKSERFELARVRLAIAGVGLAIPSATATISLREKAISPAKQDEQKEVQLGTPVSEHAAADKHSPQPMSDPGKPDSDTVAAHPAAGNSEPENHETSVPAVQPAAPTILTRVGNIASSVAAASRHLLHQLTPSPKPPSRSVLQKLAGELRDLREALEESGFS